MYKFQDLRRVRGPSMGTRPIEALCFDGHWIDDEIPIFETLSVEGRHDFKRSINSQDLSGDGSIFLSSKIPEKQLKVNFYWRANSIEDYNSWFKKLKAILYKQQVKVRFLDEQDFYYIGTVEEFTLQNVTLSTKGTITITCSNPYKYRDATEIESFDNEFTISDKELIYPTKPKKLTIVPSQDGSNIEVKNNRTEKKLMAGVAYSKNKEITFDFDKLDFLVDHVSHLIDIDLDSNFDDFLINDGDTITVNVNGSKTLEYEVKQL